MDISVQTHVQFLQKETLRRLLLNLLIKLSARRTDISPHCVKPKTASWKDKKGGRTGIILGQTTTPAVTRRRNKTPNKNNSNPFPGL
jgi:hypothetical protein